MTSEFSSVRLVCFLRDYYMCHIFSPRMCPGCIYFPCDFPLHILLPTSSAPGKSPLAFLRSSHCWKCPVLLPYLFNYNNYSYFGLLNLKICSETQCTLEVNQFQSTCHQTYSKSLAWVLDSHIFLKYLQVILRQCPWLRTGCRKHSPPKHKSEAL